MFLLPLGAALSQERGVWAAGPTVALLLLGLSAEEQSREKPAWMPGQSAGRVRTGADALGT